MNRDIQRDTILLVDDNLDIRSFAKVFLESAGYTVATAADGQEGLSFFKQHQSRIAMVLTDISMPNMNGIDLADRVLELDSELPVLFMSGDTWNSSRHGLGCVAKPFSANELIRRVTQVVGTAGKQRLEIGI
jgi:CheY-like chemotaxis protein